MPLLESLELTDFRNYEHRRFVFEADRVVLCGANGRGKTNLLEAIYFLSILRSFRTSATRELIRLGRPRFRLSGAVNKAGFREELRLEQQRGSGRALAINGTAIRRSSEFIREFRAVAFVPEDKMLVAGAAGYRRRFFDMLISVLNPEYLRRLQRYAAALAQRNAALKRQSGRAAAAAFEVELAEQGAYLGRERERYCALVETTLNRLAGTGSTYTVAYEPDFPRDEEAYRERLARDFERDQRFGFTGSGPQADEVRFLAGGEALRHYGSTGQQRLFALYLRMAEFELVSAGAAGGVLALVDDVTGELDPVNRERFFNQLRRAGQLFLTVTSRREEGFPGARWLEI